MNGQVIPRGGQRGGLLSGSLMVGLGFNNNKELLLQLTAANRFPDVPQVCSRVSHSGNYV